MNFLIEPYHKHDLTQDELRPLVASLNAFSNQVNLDVDRQMIAMGFSSSSRYDSRLSVAVIDEAVSDETLSKIIYKYKSIDAIPYDLPPEDRDRLVRLKTEQLPNTFGKSNLVYMKSVPVIKDIENELQKLIPQGRVEGQTGSFWYPERGYMGWHTNENHTGFRIYCAYSYKEQSSYFKYRNPNTGEILTCWDDLGWNVRVFRVGKTDKDRLWHCVRSTTDRLSIGFSVGE